MRQGTQRIGVPLLFHQTPDGDQLHRRIGARIPSPLAELVQRTIDADAMHLDSRRVAIELA